MLIFRLSRLCAGYVKGLAVPMIFLYSAASMIKFLILFHVLLTQSEADNVSSMRNELSGAAMKSVLQFFELCWNWWRHWVVGGLCDLKTKRPLKKISYSGQLSMGIKRFLFPKRPVLSASSHNPPIPSAHINPHWNSHPHDVFRRPSRLVIYCSPQCSLGKYNWFDSNNGFFKRYSKGDHP